MCDKSESRFATKLTFLLHFIVFFLSVVKNYIAMPVREGIFLFFKENSLIQFNKIHKKID